MILSPERLIRAGQIRKPHGIDGALKVQLEDAFQEVVDDVRFLFISIDGDQVPFRIEYIKGDFEMPIFKLERVDTPEAAALYTGADVFLEKNELPDNFDAAPVSDLEFGYLIGFSLFDDEMGLIGPIIDIEAYPQQEMALVSYREQEVLVPVHEDLIVSMDIPNRRLTMSLPEGILEL